MDFLEDIKGRETQILDLVRQGKYELSWSPVVSEHGGKKATFWVTSDALKVGGVRVNVSARSQQAIADVVGGMLMTTKVADLAFLQAQAVIRPRPMGISSSVSAMRTHSAAIDAELAKIGAAPGALVAPPGKHWVIDREVQGLFAMNYGWHFVGANFQGIRGYALEGVPGAKIGKLPVFVIQPAATAHHATHLDYSQTCSLMSQVCEVDGEQMSVDDLLLDPVLSFLASAYGRLEVLRQPGVDRPDDRAIVLPEILAR